MRTAAEGFGAPSDTTMTFLDRTNTTSGGSAGSRIQIQFLEWSFGEFDEAALVTGNDVELSWRAHEELVIFSFGSKPFFPSKRKKKPRPRKKKTTANS